MPPAASPTMMVMGLLGKSSATAGASDWHARAASTSPRRTALHIMPSPLWIFFLGTKRRRRPRRAPSSHHTTIYSFPAASERRGDRAQRYPSDPVDQVAGGLAPFGARKPPATASFSHM